MKTEDPLFDQRLLKRFFIRPAFLFTTASLLGGVIAGTMSVKLFGLLDNHSVSPLFFSIVPAISSGLIQCFSDILLNILIFLIAVFLLGATAFGAFGIPLLMFYRGITVAVGAVFLLGDGNILMLGRSALCYTPVWAAASLLLALFAARAMVFSNGLARAGFSQQQETVDFRLYLRDFIYFLCFSVVISVIGSLLAALCVLF